MHEPFELPIKVVGPPVAPTDPQPAMTRWWLTFALLLSAHVAHGTATPAPSKPLVTVLSAHTGAAADGSRAYQLIVRNVTKLEGLDVTLRFPSNAVPGPASMTGIAKGCGVASHADVTAGTMTISVACMQPVFGSGPIATFSMSRSVPSAQIVVVSCRINEQPDSCETK